MIEHIMTDWTLSKEEIDDIITLVKEELKKHQFDRIPQTYWGIILEKLMIMKND
jgi:hypothetical protein